MGGGSAMDPELRSREGNNNKNTYDNSNSNHHSLGELQTVTAFIIIIISHLALGHD